MDRKKGADKDRDALGATAKGRGVDDFDELRDYRPGDSPRHVDWKASSKNRTLIVKQFSGSYGGRLHFDFNALVGGGGFDTETALSIMCGWVVEAEERDLVFGMGLDGREVAPGSGKAHCRICLKMLALYGMHAAGGGGNE